MKAVFSRYRKVEFVERATLPDAIDYLNNREDRDEVLALGVYDEDTKTVYLTDSFGYLPGYEDEYNRRLDDFVALGFEIMKVDFYKPA